MTKTPGKAEKKQQIIGKTNIINTSSKKAGICRLFSTFLFG